MNHVIRRIRSLIGHAAGSAAAIALVAALATANPAFRMSYASGVPRAEILGDYANSRYVVVRGDRSEGPFESITVGEVLCLGACFADDPGAEPGRVYWYRFDLLTAEGERVSFGPYQATIDPRQMRPMAVAVEPNPSRAEARITVSLAGSGGPVAVEGALYDVRGRRVAELHRGSLGPGATVLRWDGRDGEGRMLAAGTYFLRFAAADGRQAVTRLVRVR